MFAVIWYCSVSSEIFLLSLLLFTFGCIHSIYSAFSNNCIFFCCYKFMFRLKPSMTIHPKIRVADKSLARLGRKQATLPAFYGTWSFITTFTTVHYLSLPKPKQSIPLPITLLTGADCFLPGQSKDLSAPRYRVTEFI